MIKFTARGFEFVCAKKLLCDKWKNNLLKDFVTNSTIQLDKVDDSIYVDINPNNINVIFDYMAFENYKKDIDLCTERDLIYLGLLNENSEEWKLQSLSESINCVDYDYDIAELFFINTRDSKKIILNKSTINLWPNCKFRDIIIGKYSDYLVEKSDNSVTTWLNINYDLCNILLCMLRDGINCYIDIIVKDKYINMVMEDYGIITSLELEIINNRYNRITNLKSPIIINNNKVIYFTEKNRRTETFQEINYHYTRGQDIIIISPFKSIKNLDCSQLWNNIHKTVDYKFIKGWVGRDEYTEKTWTYNIINSDMDILEHFYYRYLMGYID
mgnify:CR=1 FL=1